MRVQGGAARLRGGAHCRPSPTHANGVLPLPLGIFVKGDFGLIFSSGLVLVEPGDSVIFLGCGTGWEADDRKGDRGGSARCRPFLYLLGLVVALLRLLGLHGFLAVAAP